MHLKNAILNYLRFRDAQVRDPAIFVEKEVIYLLYSVRGENGIAIAKLNIN